MRHSLLLLPILGALALGGCPPEDSDAAVEVSPTDLDTQPASYDGKYVTLLVGDELSVEVLTTARACEDVTEPCNDGTGTFKVGEITLEAMAGYESPIPAFGELVLYTAGTYAFPVELGCHGNDLEMACAPTVPSAITSVTGLFDAEHAVLLVTNVDYADSPTTEVVGGMTFYTASYYDEIPEECTFDSCSRLLAPGEASE